MDQTDPLLIAAERRRHWNVAGKLGKSDTISSGNPGISISPIVFPVQSLANCGTHANTPPQVGV